MKLYSIYDKKADVFCGVYLFPSEVNAKRFCESLVRNPDAMEHQFKDDFALYDIGNFNEKKGSIYSNFETDENTGKKVPLCPQLVYDFADIVL